MATVIPQKPPVKIATEPVASKNPCACGVCTPVRVSHWYCDGCGAGPFRFQPQDPGLGKAMKPVFQRISSHYDQAQSKWIYTPRYSCSKACVEMEKDVCTTEMIEMVGHRPDLAQAVSGEVETRRQERLHAVPEPEVPLGGGAYTPGVDDL